VELPHSAVVISEQELTDRLEPAESGTETPGDTAAWTIVASRLPAGASGVARVAKQVDLDFGSRIARASAVQVKGNCAPEACWIESLDNGWLFLLPGLPSAWLLSVGGPVDVLLANSRIVGAQIESLNADAPVGQFPAHPRVSDPLCGSTWLACGNAAMAFDPICGDGAGNAVREAILASAVIKAAAATLRGDASNQPGGDVKGLFAHYRARLLVGFLKHLELCRQFYAACSGEWWAAELNGLDVGIAWCRAQLGTEPKFHYRLRGFELEPILK